MILILLLIGIGKALFDLAYNEPETEFFEITYTFSDPIELEI
jgi:hypothetical protein